MDQDSHSPDHPSLDRISALLDEPGADPGAAEHLERCERCRREHERMRRMRMALSALGGVAPPEGEWEEIEHRLAEEDAGPSLSGRAGDAVPPFGSRWAATVAAATLFFAVGLVAGLQLRDGLPAGGDAGPTAAATAGDGAGYPSAARSLESMVPGRTDTAPEPIDDPVGAVEEMARLEALAEAAREALRDRPADPALNDFLFRVSERRRSLRSRLGAAADLASMDYR